MELIFIGTGTSGCVPEISCLLQNPITCKVCSAAMKAEPQLNPHAPIIYNKNRRRNTSALIRVPNNDGHFRNILIDCGKSFYESALTWYATYGFQRIDALLLTHGHADAMMGLDDLRQWTLRGKIQKSITVYLDQSTMNVVQTCFPYLTDLNKATGGGEVAHIDFTLMKEDANGVLPFTIEDIKITPFEVEHGVVSGGDPYFALGFRIGDISYVSDVSKLPPKAKTVINGSKIVVMDALSVNPHKSHFCHQQSLEAIQELAATNGIGFFTGMTHSTAHEDIEKWLESQPIIRGIDIRCAYDGLRICENEQNIQEQNNK